jgi:hypothetical protein
LPSRVILTAMNCFNSKVIKMPRPPRPKATRSTSVSQTERSAKENTVELSNRIPKQNTLTPQGSEIGTYNGYKGHRAGSRKETVHKIFDQKGVEAARLKAELLGIRPGSFKTWLSHFRNYTAPATEGRRSC